LLIGSEGFDLKTSKSITYADRHYSQITQFPGFKPWDSWVPMPYPHRQILYAHDMFTNKDKLSVTTPDFTDFANNLQGYTSRNALITNVKKMLQMRGVRPGMFLGHAGENKDRYITIYCARAKKASAVIMNHTIHSECTFAMYFERKSCLLEPVQMGTKPIKDLGFRTNDLNESDVQVKDESPREKERVYLGAS